MAFAQKTFAPLSANSSAAPRVWTYQTNDTLATVTTVGYFIDKKFQLEQFDFILAVVQGLLVKLVVGADTSTVTPSNTVTQVIYYADADAGTYNINTGTPTEVGLQVVVPVFDPLTEDYELTVTLPSVTGSTGSTALELQIDVDGEIIKSITSQIGNSELGVVASLFSRRGVITDIGNLLVKVLVNNVSGSAVIDNTDGAELTIVQNRDVQI